ncbi:histidine kinase [uncultured Tenacibaculum sp.]|uniref:sensor histidine kinase n=1 Tax=uncultured Tenacibaculum sp. TaxID=174713 RepID=UPI0026398C1B|nr:histidine kinase [uncultured Tenacibaculum sp.]
MIQWFKQNKRIFILISFISIAIPLLWLSYKIIGTDKDSFIITVDWPSSVVFILLGYYILLILTILGIAIHWLVQQIKTIIDLKNEKKKTELIHLQTQVNPHFFFNMLNNLYGLIDRDSEKAKQLVLKLSDMMRYSVYEGLKDTVSIQEEIDFIQNFISLHQMRYKKNIDISFLTNIENNDVNIVPLLFIILVENAFKHGVEVLRNEAFVSIKLTTTNSEIKFTIKNNFDPTHVTQKGIGLENLTRRLELTYPNNHTFTTRTVNNTFEAFLSITI